MPLPLLAMSLAAKFLPSLIGKLTGSDKAGEVAEDVVNMATRITGVDDPSEAAKVLEADPKLALQFQQELHAYELGIEQERTKQLEAVNETMRAEAMSGSWAQRAWRPFNGFAFGISLFCDYFLSQIILALINSQIVWTHIPLEVYMLWSAILGVTAGSRGVEKVAKLQGPGILGIIKKAIK